MAVFKAKTATRDVRTWYYSVIYVTLSGEKDRKKSQRYLTRKEALEAERQFFIWQKHLADEQRRAEEEKKKIYITFEEMYYKYIDYIEEGIKGSTKYSKNGRVKNHILTYLGSLDIHDITVNTVINWKSKINKATYSNGKKYMLSYKQTLFKELKVALKHGVNFYGLTENVTDKVMDFHDKNEKVITDEERIRYITPVEYNLFTSVIENILFKAFFAFLYYMGVRRGEAQALTWEDISWSENQVRIIKTVITKTDEVNENGLRFKITNTKNRKNRTIKMPLILKNMLWELYQHYKEFEGFNEKWFVFGGYRHLPSSTIDREKDFYFNLVNETYGKSINRITNHEFRHSHASYLISQGVKAERIAYRLGDTVGVVLKIYAHLFPEVEDEIIEALDLVETEYKINENTKKEFLESPQAIKILNAS